MIEVEEYGALRALRISPPFLGIFPAAMTVRCYAVDGIMIDSGVSAARNEVVSFAREQKVERTVITHHHEDHSGNVGSLKEAGVRVLSSEATRPRIASGFHLHFYQRSSWGYPICGDAEVVGGTIETNRHRFEVLPAPGHCDDQIVLYERSQGWLFSGDAFLAERIKYFRIDEDFAKMIDTLSRLSELDFDGLYCAHRPVPKNGKESLQKKLDYLLEVEGEVRRLAEKGLSIKEITRRVLGREILKMYLLTWGDVSKYNIVHSILNGPGERK